MKKLPALLAVLLLSLAFPFSVCAETAETPHYSLPVNFSPGMPVDPKYYLSDTLYEDPTIRVAITTGNHEGVLYWIADIEIQDASQLRTVSAEGFDSRGVEPGTVLAKRVNAVLAVNGDFYCYSRGLPLIIRQGITFENEIGSRGGHDVLLIDSEGDFHGLVKPKKKELFDALNAHKIVNGFCFGPLLVDYGQISDSAALSLNPTQTSQRVAIAQTGHLKYRVIVSGPPKRGSKAFLFEEWRRFVADMDDIWIAYNLDGGDSAVLVFNNRKINDPDNWDERQLADIIYFASAWPGE